MRVIVYRGAEKGAAAVGRLVKEIDGVALAEEVRGPARVTVGLSEPVLQRVSWVGLVWLLSCRGNTYSTCLPDAMDED